MKQSISVVALVVNDYDEAIRFYTNCLRFELVEDTILTSNKRWVMFLSSGGGTALLLAKASTPLQSTRIGDQTGGRVFLFLQTDDLLRDYQDMQSRGVKFIEESRIEKYGMVVVFLDLYGNRWDLIQPN